MAQQRLTTDRTAFRTLLFSTTLFLSAGLMFMVQPMIGKMMLPYVGGAPSGWLVAMAFFQLILLAGYGFAHILSRFSVRAHMALVCAVLASGLLMLPLQFRMSADVPNATHVLVALFVCSSLPFFALSTVGSSLQRLFAAAEGESDPYFLFAASNLGSFFGLLLYPFWAERHYGLLAQAAGWRCGYALLIAASVMCLLAAGRRAQEGTKSIAPAAAPSWMQRARWVLLAFVPSSLMLGATSYISVEAGSIPFFWVIPLALYLLTFVLAFARKTLISLKALMCFQPLALAFVVFALVERPFTPEMGLSSLYAAVIAFFLSALLCHSLLAAERPAAARLTEYYLWIALGGALGGSFNAFVAPFLFPLPVEFIAVVLITPWLYRDPAAKALKAKPLVPAIAIAVAFAATLAFGLLNAHGQSVKPDVTASSLTLAGGECFLLLVSLAVLCLWPKALVITAPMLALLSFMLQTEPMLVTAQRNFFGVWRIYDVPFKGKTVRTLAHGSTLHDMQPIKPTRDTAPHSYYYREGPMGAIFATLNPKNVAVIGLGAGALACYNAPGRHYTFYEIDRDVAGLARDYFDYFHACGAPDIVIGDGRRALAAAKDARYDLLIIDAFTSDMIPLHLLTREAFALYLDRLAPGGVIAVHISSHYYDLRSPLSAAAEALDLHGLAFFNDASRQASKISDPFAFRSNWVILAREKGTLAPFKAKGWRDLPPAHTRLWTDDYSDALSVLEITKP